MSKWRERACVLAAWLVVPGPALVLAAVTLAAMEEARPTTEDFRQARARRLPPGTVVVAEKSPEWWVVEVDGARFLGRYNGGWTLTPMVAK